MRRDYQLQAKTRPDHNVVVQMRCPAAGDSATVDCPLKPRKSEAVGLGMPKLRPRVENPPEHPDRICANRESVAFGPEAGLKHRQDVPYATEEWRRLYNPFRNTVESANRQVKDEAHSDTAEPGLRRYRGYTLNLLVTTLHLLSTNLRRIKSFLTKHEDEQSRPPKPDDKRRRAKTLADYRPDPNAPPAVGPAAEIA